MRCSSAPVRIRTVVGPVLTTLALAVATPSLTPAPAYAVSSGVTATVVDGDLRIVGSERDDSIIVRLRPGNDQLIEVQTGLSRAPEFTFRRPTVQRISITTAAGADRATVDDRYGAVAQTIPVTIDGGEGDDTLSGGIGEEVVLAGAGSDLVDGRGGNDQILLGSGDDQAVWAPGHGTDVIEGQTGNDRIAADGTVAADHVEIAANGSRLRLFRPGQPGAADTAGVEQWTVRPGAGSDTVVVNDLSGTAATAVDLDLDASGGGPTDGWPDQIEVAGTAAADAIAVGREGGAVEVSAGPRRVRVFGADWFVDRLVVDADLGDDRLTADPAAGALLKVRLDGGHGDDTVTANGTSGYDDIAVSKSDDRVQVNKSGAAFDATAEHTVVNGLGGGDLLRATADLDALTELVLDGGDGSDQISGGDGREQLIGGEGNDQVIGHGGADVLLLGPDQDTTSWSAGDGDDIVEGGSGSDVVFLVGDAAVDQIEVSAAGSRNRVVRNDDVLDLGDVERLSLHPLRGADSIAIRNVSGTPLYEIVADLGATVGGAGDGEADRVRLDLTNGADQVALIGDTDYFSAQGLAWSPRIRHTDGTLDQLVVDTLAGTDQVSTNGLLPGTIGLSIV